MLDRTGNGYLEDPTIWSEEIMFEMAKEDDIVLTESMVKQIMQARDTLKRIKPCHQLEHSLSMLVLIRRCYSKNG